ncbi:MAG TPA: hypothetical protein DDX98_04835 [Bacteroidales bacterium]|jgi:hypothetical protein|nr:hypothetical protein [Bacteroidales bacterium]
MKKINIAAILSIVVLFISLVGCQNLEQEPEAPISPDGYPKSTLTNDFGGETLTEGDTITYVVKIDKPMDHDITFTAEDISGTDDHDFTIEGGTIAAYTDSAQMMIIFTRDYEIEGDETYELRVGVLDIGNRYRLNPESTNDLITVTVQNWVSDVLVATFGWEMDVWIDYLIPYEVEPSGEYANTYDWVDVDIFLADAAGYDPANPWANFNPSIYAATGDTPEEMEIDFDILADGEYYIFSELFSNGLVMINNLSQPAPLDTTYDVEDVPMYITSTFERQGSFLPFSVVSDETETLTTLNPGIDDAEWAGEVVNTTLCKLIVDNGIYIIEDINMNEIGRGKINNRDARRPDDLMKK